MVPATRLGICVSSPAGARVKVAFVSPTYGPIESAAIRTQRAAIMHAASHGVTWVGDASPERMAFAAARNIAVDAVLTGTDADAIFWCDSDVILPPDAISKLAAAQLDFVTGIYCQRSQPYWPLIAHFNRQKGTFNWWTQWPEQVLAPVDGCGFGCVLTSTKMLRQMDAPWFAFTKFSEDFDFCLKAAALGYQLYVDTGVLCGHLADPKPVTLSDFAAVRDSGGLDHHGSIRPNSAA